VAAPRRRLPLLRLAALPAARAERRASGGVENGFYVRRLPAEARLASSGESREKNTRNAGEGSPSLGPLKRPYPSLPSREASPVSIGKEGYHNNDEDDQKPGRHSDPFLGSGPTLRGMWESQWLGDEAA
jgi:hypothetical protein